jgi:hypothetical protein
LNVDPDSGRPAMAGSRESGDQFQQLEKPMTGFKTLGAAAMLSMMIATPVFAQATIEEPGAYSFYHPYSDPLNAYGPSAPAGAMAAMPYGDSRASAYMNGDADASSCVRYRSYNPATGTFLGRDGMRHSCQ